MYFLMTDKKKRNVVKKVRQNVQRSLLVNTNFTGTLLIAKVQPMSNLYFIPTFHLLPVY